MRARLLSMGFVLMLADARAQPVPAGDHLQIARTPIVRACVDRKGALRRLELARSSGLPDIDAAALDVAQQSNFTPGRQPNGKPLELSCVKFEVKFVLRNGAPPPAES
jgi:TonB family protein